MKKDNIPAKVSFRHSAGEGILGTVNRIHTYLLE
jgi:hypothetical protein